MARTRKARVVRKHSTNLAIVPESPRPSADDPEIEAILEGTDNKAMEHPVDTESNKQPEPDPEEGGTPVSVYVGCLAPPSPEVGSPPLPTPPLCRRRSARFMERYRKSRERFMGRARNIRHQTSDSMTKSRAARDIRRIYSAMREAKLKLEPLCIKQLFQRDSSD